MSEHLQIAILGLEAFLVWATDLAQETSSELRHVTSERYDGMPVSGYYLLIKFLSDLHGHDTDVAECDVAFLAVLNKLGWVLVFMLTE